jgi:large subunit ribosomal protein L25
LLFVTPETKEEAMDFAKVDAEVRQETGKGNARRTRAAGRVPAVLYGRREQPLSLSLDPLALVRSLDKERKRNTVFSLKVADGGKATDVTAMIRDVQIDPLSRRITHVDFLRVDLEDEVRVLVPLVLVGTPAGVIDGGNLHHNVHSIPIAAKPAAIPTKIELDVSKLKIGEALHVSDLKLPAGMRALLEAKAGLASVVAPRAEKVEEAAAAAPAEGAAAAAPAAGEAAKGKEGAPAAGGDKKAAAAPAAAGKDDKKK